MGAERQTHGDVTLESCRRSVYEGLSEPSRERIIRFVNVINVDLFFSSVQQKLGKIDLKF